MGRDQFSQLRHYPIAPAAFTERFENQKLPCWVAAANDTVFGYASARYFRPFAGSAHVAETAIYLRQEIRGHGVGERLYQKLLDHLPEDGFTVAVALITDPNPASEQLHRKLGFIRQGILPDLGRKNGQSLTASVWTKKINRGVA